MEKITRTDAIRQHCLECVGGVRKEVKLCTAQKCNLFQYRLGRGMKAIDLKRNIENIQQNSQKLVQEDIEAGAERFV